MKLSSVILRSLLAALSVIGSGAYGADANTWDSNFESARQAFKEGKLDAADKYISAALQEAIKPENNIVVKGLTPDIQERYKKLESDLNSQHLNLARTVAEIDLLGRNYESLNHFDKAISLYKLSYSASEKVYGAGSAELIHALDRLASCAVSAKNMPQAENYYKQARTIVNNNQHSLTRAQAASASSMLLGYGLLLGNLHREADASAAFEQAKTLTEASKRHSRL